MDVQNWMYKAKPKIKIPPSESVFTAGYNVNVITLRRIFGNWRNKGWGLIELPASVATEREMAPQRTV